MSLFMYETVIMAVRKGLPDNANIHGHNTRLAHNYNLPYHWTKLFEKKPIGAKFLNALPEELKKDRTCETDDFPENVVFTVAEFFKWRDFYLNGS